MAWKLSVVKGNGTEGKQLSCTNNATLDSCKGSVCIACFLLHVRTCTYVITIEVSPRLVSGGHSCIRTYVHTYVCMYMCSE